MLRIDIQMSCINGIKYFVSFSRMKRLKQLIMRLHVLCPQPEHLLVLKIHSMEIVALLEPLQRNYLHCIEPQHSANVEYPIKIKVQQKYSRSNVPLQIHVAMSLAILLKIVSVPQKSLAKHVTELQTAKNHSEYKKQSVHWFH